MQYIKQIVNQEDTDDNNLKVISRYINEYIAERKFKRDYIKKDRDFCYKESFKLYDYFTKNRVKSKYVKGYFIVEDLSGLKLSLKDLYSTEMEEFIDYISEEFEDPKSISENDLVYAFAEHKGIGDFLTYPHAWVELDNIIIDMTYEQFEKACPSGITKENYVEGQ